MIFIAPAVGAALHLSLPGIMLLLAAGLTVSLSGYLGFCLRVRPELKREVAVDRAILRPLLSFGGWITVSALVVPVLVYTDRILLSGLVSVAALAYYTVPYEIVFRLQIFPASFGTALFPTFTAVTTTRREELDSLYARSIKYLLLVMAPVTLLVVLFAHSVLQVWISPDFASHSTVVFQILAFGMLLNAVSQIPSQLLDSYGRPDLRAKVFLAYMPGYVLLAWLLISHFGLVGAAIGWTVRSGVELAIFFVAAWLLLKLKLAVFTYHRVTRAVAVIAVCTAAVCVVLQMGAPWAIPSLGLFTLLALGTGLWLYALDGRERSQLGAVVHLHPGKVAP